MSNEVDDPSNRYGVSPRAITQEAELGICPVFKNAQTNSTTWAGGINAAAGKVVGQSSLMKTAGS